MASLESFAGAGVTATRSTATQTISITGGLLQVTGYLDAGTVPPGWRIDCSSSGGLAFNLPDAAAATLSISSRNGSMILLAAGHDGLVTGDALEKDGDLGDLDNGTVYYVEKGSANTIYLHATRAQALAGLSATRISAGTGNVPGGDGGLDLAAGRRDIGVIGDLEGPEVQIIERADAHAFRGDNFSNASEVSRFQAGKVTLRNFYWESLRPNGSGDASRSDFDVANGAEPILQRGEIATLAAYNHLASSLLQIDDLRFRNRTASLEQTALEFARPFATPPQGLAILPAGRKLRVLAADLADGVPAKFPDLSASFFDIFPNGISESAGNAKAVWLVDPAGTPTKGRSTGLVEIRRAVRLDFGPEQSGTGGSCRLIPTDSNPPYSADTVDDAETGPHLFPEVLHRRAAGGETAFTDWKNYRWLKVSPSYRKATGTFAVADQTEAGQTQTVSATLTREVWPDGTAYAHSTVSTAASVDDLYRAIKAHELANPKDGGAAVSLAVINADGYIQLGDGFSLNLSSIETDLTNWDAATETLTVKASTTVAASAKGVLGVQASGTGTIFETGNVDISAWLYKLASGGNSMVAVSAAEAGVKLSLYAADGTLIGTHTTAAGSLSATFRATAAQSTAGCRLLASRLGFEPESRTLDLSAGGSFAEAFGPRTEIVQFDGTATYAAADVSSVSTATFSVSNPASVSAKLDVANEQLSAIAAFSTFASKAHSTASGQKYLAFGGAQPRALALFSGDLLSIPSGVQIRRRAAGNANASILATVIAEGSGTVLDESRGAVQFSGGIQLADFQRAILADWDLDPTEAGTQSVGAKLLALGTIAASNATAIAALPSSVTIASAVLGSSVAIGGDTVAEALARTAGLPTGSAPSANAVRDAVLAAPVATGGDTVKQSLARISGLPTGTAPTAAAIRDAILSAEVVSGGATAKAALANAAGLPSASAVATEVLGATVSGSRDVETALKVALAVLGGTAARTGNSIAFSVDGTTVISATVDAGGDGSRTDVVIA